MATTSAHHPQQQLFGLAAPQHEDHGVLNASLRVLVLPLVCRVRSARPTVDIRRRDLAPFLPGRLAAARGLDRHPAVAHDELEIPAPTADGAVALGFGPSELLATRVFAAEEAPDVVFGTSAMTLDEVGDDLEGHVWRGQESVCISLWATDAGAVLTVEHVAPLDLDNGITCPLAQHVDRDLLGALPLMRTRTHLPEGFSLQDVFGWFTAWRLVGPRAARTDLRDFRVHSSERIRGRALTEAFYAVLAPCATPVVAGLVAGEDDFRVDDEQDSGTAWTWNRLDVVTAPAEPGAVSALRNDNRAVYLNLEALSVRHDYMTHAPGLVLAALPVVAHRAVTEHAMRQLEGLAESTRTKRDLAAQLDALDRGRASSIRRRLSVRLASVERFADWSISSQLASILLRESGAYMTSLDAEVAELSEEMREIVNDTRERRRQKVDRVVNISSPIAAIAVLLGLYSGLVSLPDLTTQTLISAVPDAIGVTAVLVGVGVLIGLAIDRVAHGRRR